MVLVEKQHLRSGLIELLFCPRYSSIGVYAAWSFQFEEFRYCDQHGCNFGGFVMTVHKKKEIQ